MTLDISLFADPWEHIRLLSDGPRNAALVGFLAKHAPGRRVLEIGCGSGLLSLVAARLGASEVIAIEPSGIVELAKELVARNGVKNVTILEGRIEDLKPRKVDVIFSELLNADPFFEGVLGVSVAARRWLAPGGLIAPRRLRVWAAAARAGEAAREAREASREIQAFAKRFELDASPLLDAIGSDPSHRYLSLVEAPIGPPVLLWDVELGSRLEPDEEVEVDLPVFDPGPVGGALIWFEAELDDEYVLHNRPGEPSHWGQQVCAFAEERGVRAGGALRVRFERDEDDELHAHPLGVR